MSEQSLAKLAWDPKTQGYGKHAYHKIDPSTINPEDYARGLIGEQQHFGDVREYNTGDNEKHPETCDIDALSRIGTLFETNAVGFEGKWRVTDLPEVRLPNVYIKASKDDGGKEQALDGTELGVKTGEDNLWRQVRTVIVERGQLGKAQRERLTKL